jgi:pyruvate/2-oxoglutarate dehydrogenase complex dihydrolipoamide acyltransferase (E2) component
MVPADQRAGRCGHVGVSCAAVAYEFKLPDLGEGLTEAEIARWLVAEGDHVDEDQPFVEVQTDKTTVEIPSPRAGTVLKILVEEGEIAPVGAVLVVIGDAGEQLLRAVEPGERRVGSDAGAEPLVAVVPTDPTAAVRATPAVRQLAKQLGVELVGLPGSGPGGRIVEEDVHAAAGAAGGRRVPVRGIRRAIVEQVTRTHREVPAVTFVEECDFSGVDLARLVPLAIHAAARALARFPELNARLEGDEIVLLERVDVGIAVQTEDGLVVPVVRSCERLTVDEIAAEAARLADGARAGTLAAHELRDSTFTVTSAGKLGGLFVTPLVNHPEVAILGLHRVSERPVVRDGQVVVRPVGNVSVSFDHRVVDGVRAAAFCLDVIDRLQSAGRDDA